MFLDRLEWRGILPGDVFGTGDVTFDNLFVLGTGSAALDTHARYLYLYQQVDAPSSGEAFVADIYGDGTNKFRGATSYGEWNLGNALRQPWSHF